MMLLPTPVRELPALLIPELADCGGMYGEWTMEKRLDESHCLALLAALDKPGVGVGDSNKPEEEAR